MDKFGKSQSVTRVEDIRFLTGQGRYIDDISPEGALRLVVVRSSVAHARIIAIDTEAARAVPGVHLVVTGADLNAAGVTYGMGYSVLKNRDGSQAAAPKRPILTTDKIRFVGEALAFVVADTLHAAQEAAELVDIDYDELPAHMDQAPLRTPGTAPIHAEAPDNRVFDWAIGDAAATDAAFAKAARVVTLDVDDNRVIINAMEPRGAFAEWDGARLHVAFGGQGVWGLKGELKACFGLDDDAVRVTNPDVGGGFGMKAMNYPEYFMVAHAARALGRPVRWMSERTEAMLSDNGGRDLSHTAALAFDDTGKITAYKIDTLCNIGAYNSNFAQYIQTELFAKVLMGPYDVQTIYCRCQGFFTNTTQIDAYRGAGRPEAIYLLERLIDRAARDMEMDPLDLRRRNFIAPTQFPYLTATGETYDVGDFVRVMDRAANFADVAGFATRRATAATKGKLRGLGSCYYIESILGAPAEDVQVDFNDDGTATIYVGTQSNGQGHETVFAQFLSDQTGIPTTKIRFVQGDSDRIARGGGTGGSRSVTVQANVTLTAVSTIITAFAEFLAPDMGVDPADITFDDETFRAEGSNLTPTMLEVAQMARAAGRSDLLSFKAHSTLPGRSYPNGCHIAEIEIDTDTGVTEVVRYTIVDDFGNLINPMLAEGQVHGGVAQGIGQAITERVVYDEDGQLLTATFMDYAMPRAADVPMVAFDTEAVPSTTNPMGMKGCGEAGTVGALAAVANAVQDALWDRGIRQVDMPFTPHRVWQMLHTKAMAAQ